MVFLSLQDVHVNQRKQNNQQINKSTNITIGFDTIEINLVYNSVKINSERVLMDTTESCVWIANFMTQVKQGGGIIKHCKKVVQLMLLHNKSINQL